MTLQEKYEKQKEINKELVDENEALKFAARMREKTEKQLRAEIEEFKETNHELAELAIKRQKEIDELEKCRQILSDCTDRQRKETKELEKELQKWKDEWQEQVQKAIDEGYARTLQTMQLTKATELLKQWVELYKPKLEGYPITPIQEQTEQFLKEAAE